MSSLAPPPQSRDTLRTRTPMRCPICDATLSRVMVRDLGGVTAGTVWQVHAGECPDHGWFQTEIVSRPPREIFAVTKPFGAARRVVVNGREHFSFSTVWNELPGDERRKPTNPLEPKYWRVSSLSQQDS